MCLKIILLIVAVAITTLYVTAVHWRMIHCYRHGWYFCLADCEMRCEIKLFWLWCSHWKWIICRHQENMFETGIDKTFKLYRIQCLEYYSVQCSHSHYNNLCHGCALKDDSLLQTRVIFLPGGLWTEMWNQIILTVMLPWKWMLYSHQEKHAQYRYR